MKMPTSGCIIAVSIMQLVIDVPMVYSEERKVTISGQTSIKRFSGMKLVRNLENKTNVGDNVQDMFFLCEKREDEALCDNGGMSLTESTRKGCNRL